MKQSRLINIQKNETLLNALKFAIRELGIRYNIKGYDYIAQKLFFSSKVGATNLHQILNPFTDKYLKVDELLIILDNLDDDLRYDILNVIANRYDFVVSKKVKDDVNISDFKDLLLNISSNDGKLIDTFIAAIKDNKITSDEKKEILKSTYILQSLIKHFEDIIKKVEDE